MPEDERLRYAATERNRQVILETITPHLPNTGLVLEIASGSGEHLLHFARQLPELRFQASDPDPACRRSIDAWRADAGLPNLLPALEVHADRADWPAQLEGAAREPDAIFNANMIHIAPWAAATGLLRGAGVLLSSGAPLILYGPYKRDGQHTAPSNEAFDQSLRSRDPSWGVRDLEAVCAEAEKQSLRLAELYEMPANNLTLVFRKELERYRSSAGSRGVGLPKSQP